LLPLLLDAVNHGSITIKKLIELTAYNPAQIFQIPNKGVIAKDFDADLVVCDMCETKKIQNRKLYTSCGWSPFDGFELLGSPIYTIVNGTIVFDKGKIKENTPGQEVIFNN